MLNKIQILKLSLIAIVTVLAAHTMAAEHKEGELLQIDVPLGGNNALERFKKKLARMDQASLEKEEHVFDEPRLMLAKYIHQNKGQALTETQWQRVYFSLFSLVGAQSFEYVKEKYRDVIEVLQENWADFDPLLERPATEGGFFPNEKVKIIHPIAPNHTDIVFGGGLNQWLYQGSAYLVNVCSTEDHLKELVEVFADDDSPALPKIMKKLKEATPVDMVADMNNAEQLAIIPDGHFTRVYAEHIPPQDYWNHKFFQNAKRILRDDGTLLIDASTEKLMKKEPYNIRDLGKYFEKNGFKLESVGPCNYPIIKGRKGEMCFHLKKNGGVSPRGLPLR